MTTTTTTTRREPLRTDAEAMVLFEANQGLVGMVLTQRYRRRLDRFEDELKNAGLRGLWRAARFFDEARGFAFSTYATWCIRSEMGGTIEKEVAGEGKRTMISLADVPPSAHPVAREEVRQQDDEEQGDVVRLVCRVAPKATERERECLTLLAQGNSRKRAARLMGVTKQRIGQMLQNVRERAARPAPEPQPEGTYTVKTAARLLDLTVDVVRHKCRKLGLRREAARHAGYLITAEQLPLLARQRSKRKQQGHPMTDDVTTMMMTTTTTTNNTDVPARSDGLLLTSAEVARQLAICTRTLWRLVEDGQFPQPIRLGRKLVRWRRKDVDAWVASLGQTKDVVEDAA